MLTSTSMALSALHLKATRQSPGHTTMSLTTMSPGCHHHVPPADWRMSDRTMMGCPMHFVRFFRLGRERAGFVHPMEVPVRF